jgi:hypothetical protein
VASLHTSYMQAYLQEQFDQAAAPNVKYALGRVLAETIPMLKEHAEDPPPGEEEIPEPAEEEAGDGVPLQVGADEAEWEELPEMELDSEPEEEWEEGEVPFMPDEGEPPLAGTQVD